MPQMVGFFLVAIAVAIVLFALAIYFFHRARVLSNELESTKQRLAELSWSSAGDHSGPGDREKEKELSEFERAQLAAHLQAEEQARALLAWESEGGLVDLEQHDGGNEGVEQLHRDRLPTSGNAARTADQPDGSSRHFDHLWLDIGGEGG